ncbi:MAG: nucleotidyltransferase domain-containing protein [Deltaproteobacteria bacterium]|nr:nucleotidyltransferase domain-containing protein [Deltaproteobacteria bacterium]
MKKLRGLKKQEIEAVNEFCTGVKKTLGSNLVELKLFGSKARGEGSRDSDIDVAVVVRRRNAGAWDRIMDIAFDVNLKWGVYISPRVLESRSLKDPKWRVTGFVKNLQREGIPL